MAVLFAVFVIPIVNASSIQDYSYVKSNTIIGSPDGELNNYPIQLVVHSGPGTDYGPNVYLNGHSESWPNDLRFTDNSNNLLSYWIESYDSDSAIVWVNVNNIPLSPVATTVKLYYGRSGDPVASNGAATFALFDDFNASSINPSKWTVSTVGGGSVTESQGLIALAANTYQNARLTSTSSFTRPMVIGTMFEPVGGSGLGVRDRFSSSNVLQAPFSFDAGIYNADNYGIDVYWGGSTGPVFNTNTFYRSEEVFIPGTSVKWTIYSSNRVSLYTNSASTSKASYKPDYAVGDFPPVSSYDFGNMNLDWMYVRNYTPNEPILGAWSTEKAVQPSDYLGLALIALVLAILVIIALLIAVFTLIGYTIGKRKQ